MLTIQALFVFSDDSALGESCKNKIYILLEGTQEGTQEGTERFW